MYIFKVSNQSCLQKQVKIKGNPFCKRNIRSSLGNTRSKWQIVTHVRATLESQHQYCSVDVLSKYKVWHKKDRPYYDYSHPEQQISVHTFSFKPALHSKLNCNQKGRYHFPIWIPRVLPDWASRCFSKGTPNRAVPQVKSEQHRMLIQGERLDLNPV